MEQTKQASRTRLLLGIGVGAWLVYAWGRKRAEGAAMDHPNFRPAHRERLYDTDGQRVAGTAQGTPSRAGEQGRQQDREAPAHGTAPGDFRHGGLSVRGHVAEAPHLAASEPSGQGRPAADAGRYQGGDFGGGFQSWGHVPEAPQGHRSAEAREDVDFDPDYLQWREEQLRQLDEDYRAWRRHKFAEDFKQWRTRSSGGAG
ncbi:hypothetical protein [Azohydromonas australica]|uniref:hypothetical protein n=1 Tax=Azohydromonas australica TaxID=364039 RepID=UPI0003FE319F|nr:hypothetical protein [Azohydromonas australica]